MNVALILAGGTGERVGAPVPKQFVEICGKPVVVHTLERFEACLDVDRVVVACVPSWVGEMRSLASRFGLLKVTDVIDGGATYQETVMRGVDFLGAVCTEDDVVAVHFAASPFVTGDIISESIRVAAEHGNGISADPVVLCLAEKDPLDGDRSSLIGHDRDRMVGLNSPQSFRFGYLRDLYAEGKERGVLDRIDPHTTTLMAALGRRLYFSKGSTANIKITTPEDLKLFEGWVLCSSADSHCAVPEPPCRKQNLERRI